MGIFAPHSITTESDDGGVVVTQGGKAASVIS